ncbi:MAG: membrane protein insertase YidC [Candidatus Eisenbacteria bacterium]|nr:membrane protein insertase YidC [Candidatus Eisenbacteria bacterium]
MDEKRAILAVVLIFLIWFTFTQYQTWQSQKAAVQEPGAPESGEIVAQGTTPGDTRSTPDADSVGGTLGERPVVPATEASRTRVENDGAGLGTAPELGVADAPERVVTVESPLWVATISNRGGAITSWRLREYDQRLEDSEEGSAEPVNLVPPGRSALSLSIGYGETTADVDRWVFDHVGPEHVELGDGRESATVRYSTTRDDGLTVVREYVFDARSYAFELHVEVSGLRERTARRDLWIGWPGVEPTDAKEDRKASASAARVDGSVNRQDYGTFAKEAKEVTRVGTIEWVTSQSRYFMAAVAPVDATFREAIAVGVPDVQGVGFLAALPMDGEAASQTFRVFAGPQDYSRVSGVGIGLERAIYLGYPWVRPLSVVLLRAMVWAYRYVRNYGLVIIIFSVLTKLLFYRLTHKSFTEMKRMQDVQPKLNALKEKYGDDKEALAKAQMELYKKEGVNPLGSCLPMILQMPVFFALFQVLRTTIELRGAPFMLWITDLSQPDTIATIAGFPIHVLPLLMGLAMLAQQRFTTTDPSQAGIGKMMPILFTALFYSFSSGLVVYWLVNTVLSVGQQYYIHRGSLAASDVSPDAVAPDGVRHGAPVSVTAVEGFEEAEVAKEDATGQPAAKRNQSKGRGGRRRKKK